MADHEDVARNVGSQQIDSKVQETVRLKRLRVQVGGLLCVLVRATVSYHSFTLVFLTVTESVSKRFCSVTLDVGC